MTGVDRHESAVADVSVLLNASSQLQSSDERDPLPGIELKMFEHVS